MVAGNIGSSERPSYALVDDAINVASRIQTLNKDFGTQTMPATLGTSHPAIRTLLLCDLVASTQIVEHVGDSAAADLLARHDRIARDLVSAFNGR